MGEFNPEADYRIIPSDPTAGAGVAQQGGAGGSAGSQGIEASLDEKFGKLKQLAERFPADPIIGDEPAEAAAGAVSEDETTTDVGNECLEEKYQQAAELLRQIRELQVQLDGKFPHLDELGKLSNTEYRNDPLFTQVRDLRNKLSDLKSEASFGPAEREKLIEKYGLGSLYDGADDPEHEAHGILNVLGERIAELKFALLVEDKEVVISLDETIRQLFEEFKEKFPSAIDETASLEREILGDRLHKSLLGYEKSQDAATQQVAEAEETPDANELDEMYQEMVELYNQGLSLEQDDTDRDQIERKLSILYKRVRDIELQGLIARYNLQTLYEGTDSKEFQNLLYPLANNFTELKMALFCEGGEKAINANTLIERLLNDIRQKFPDAEISSAYVKTDVLGNELFQKLLGYLLAEEPETQQTQAESAEGEAQRAGCIAKAISGLIGTGKHLSKFVKNPRIQKALAVSSGVILASLFGAPLAAGATGGAIVCGGMKLGVGIYKGFKEGKLKALVGNLAKGAGSGLKDFLLSPFNAPKKRPLEFKKISQQRLKFKEQSRFKHFVNKWVLEGVAGRGLGIGLGLTVAMVNELPVNSAVRILGQIFGLQVTEPAISAYAAGFIPRQFLLLADMLEKRDEKILRVRFERIGRNYDQEKEKYYHSGQTLRRVANVMAKTASFIAAAAEITNLDERILADNPTLARSINVTRGKASIRKLFGTSRTEEVIASRTEEPVIEKPTPEPTPQPEGTPEPIIEGSAEQSPTGIDQPELEVEETAPEITNGGSISDRTGLEPQASVGDVEELELKEIVKPDVTVEQGDTFWGSMEIENEGWTNPANGVTQGDVIRDATADLLRAKGIEVDMIPAGSSFDLAKILTTEEEELLRRIAGTTSVNDYRINVQPEYLRLVKEAAAEAMKPKGVN